jgi:hypothetical protein
VAGIQSPTYYLEGEISANAAALLTMFTLGDRVNAPFAYRIIEGADHFNILAPVNRLLASRVASDTGSRFELGGDEVAQAVVNASLLYDMKPIPLVDDLTIAFPDGAQQPAVDVAHPVLERREAQMGSALLSVTRFAAEGQGAARVREVLDRMRPALGVDAIDPKLLRTRMFHGHEGAEFPLRGEFRSGRGVAISAPTEVALVVLTWPSSMRTPTTWDDVVAGIERAP